LFGYKETEKQPIKETPPPAIKIIPEDPEAWRIHKCYKCGARYPLLKTSRGDICRSCAEKMVASDLLKLGVRLKDALPK
jgi:DNA-directed RNA polymerase subunit RPC12/RpoP